MRGRGGEGERGREGERERRDCRGNAPVLAPDKKTGDCRGNAPVLAPDRQGTVGAMPLCLPRIGREGINYQLSIINYQLSNE